MRPVDSKMKHASSIDQRLIVPGRMEFEVLLPCRGTITVFTSSRASIPAVENKIDEALVSCVLSKEHVETIV